MGPVDNMTVIEKCAIKQDKSKLAVFNRPHGELDSPSTKSQYLCFFSKALAAVEGSHGAKHSSQRGKQPETGSSCSKIQPGCHHSTAGTTRYYQLFLAQAEKFPGLSGKKIRMKQGLLRQ